MGLLSDIEIKELAEGGMITPYRSEKVRIRGWASTAGVIPAISFGSSSYGYDLTLSADDFRIFRHVPGLIVDPKNFDDRCLEPAVMRTDTSGWYFILPGHTYALGVTRERLKLPSDITALFIGKSTYARCGIITNFTPGEAGWEGNLTLEISNSSGADCRIYAGEGICQALFFRGNPCRKPYGDGKYQKQGAKVTLAKM